MKGTQGLLLFVLKSILIYTFMYVNLLIRLHVYGGPVDKSPVFSFLSLAHRDVLELTLSPREWFIS